MNKIDIAIELFDTYNKQDPRTLSINGEVYAYEYYYALQLYNWVKKLQPEASNALLLASRCQHIGRWKIPRESYPADKIGYHKWRTDLAKFHSDTATALMEQAGIEEELIQSVQRIIMKKQLRTDPEVQVMENALCLVFLEFQYDDFLQKHDDDTMVRIIQKSWNKMTTPGKEAALSLAFQGRGKDLLEKALQTS